MGLHYCTIQIDMDTTMRPTEQRFGGLTVEEQAAIDALMAPYRREWGDSPVLRRYGRVPHCDAHAVARRIFELAGRKLCLHNVQPSQQLRVTRAAAGGLAGATE